LNYYLIYPNAVLQQIVPNPTTMITLQVGNKVAYVNNDKVKSEFILGMISDLGSEGGVIPVLERFHGIIGNYINFLHGKPSEIVSASKLLTAFEMDTYFLDVGYFKYLIAQLLQHWSVYSQEFFQLLTDDDLFREICLFLPLPLVPDFYIFKPSFIREWLKIATTGQIMTTVANKEADKVATKTVNIPQLQRLLDNHISIRIKVRSYKNTDSDIDGSVSRIAVILYDQQTGSSEITYYYFYSGLLANHVKEIKYVSGDGEHIQYSYKREFSETGTLTREAETTHMRNADTGNDDTRDLVLDYYSNNQLARRVEELNNDLDGLQENYLESGKLIRRAEYLGGIQHGLHHFYDETSQCYITYHYDMEIKQGQYQKVSDNGQILVEGQYLNDLRTGQWYRYYPQRDEYTLTNYENDVRNGLFQVYRVDGSLIISGHYRDDRIVGKLHRY